MIIIKPRRTPCTLFLAGMGMWEELSMVVDKIGGGHVVIRKLNEELKLKVTTNL